MKRFFAWFVDWVLSLPVIRRVDRCDPFGQLTDVILRRREPTSSQVDS